MKIKYVVALAFMALIAATCRDQKNRIEGIPISDSYNNCEEIYVDYGDMITIGDPGDKFMIRLPYSWDIQENYTDTLYGIIASNRYEAGNDPQKFVLLSITGYQTTDSLQVYFVNELKNLKKDKSMKVLEVGEMDLDGKNTFWVKFESKQFDYKIMNIVQYMKSEYKNEIYLIQSSVYKSDDYDTQLCRLKQLAKSFEMVNSN